MKSVYRFYRKTIESGLFAPVDVWGKYVILLGNTSATNIKIAIESEEFEELPAGIRVQLPEGLAFTHLKFKNVSGAACTIEFAVSAGDIIDNRVVISGDLSVTDIANAISTPTPIIALDKNYLIDNAAAVDKGGGKVGIPVTGHPFATGEILTIANSTNYNEVDHVVDATSTANEVVITYAFNAETFDGVDDSIGLTTPRSIALDTTQKELIVQNNGDFDVWFGDDNVYPPTFKGIELASKDVATLSTTAEIYFMSDTAGKSGVVVSFNRLQKT